MGHRQSCMKKSKSMKTNYVRKMFSKAYEGPPGSYAVIAKYSYDKTWDEAIAFEANEIMYVIKEYTEFWFDVIKDKDHTRGMVPSNYVCKLDGSPQSVNAWRDIQRLDAEKLLMRVGLKRGTYLLRQCKKDNCFALSVRDMDETKKTSIVKHFQIKTTKKNDNTVYTVNEKRFSDIISLITHYEKTGIGNTHIQLTEPPPDDYQPPVHFQDLEISRGNIEILAEIGRGNFGTVHKAKWGRSYEVAVKMFQSTKTDREKFLKEAKIMHKLRHRKIVELLGVCTEPRNMPIFIVVELMKNGSLKQFLQSAEGKELNVSSMTSMMIDIAEGMDYLENANVVHRDLRADNVLVADNKSVKVADFGLTQVFGDIMNENDRSNLRFPYKWTAPEAAITRIFTFKSDVWSFGIVMYEILTWGRTPYPDIPGKDVISRVSEGYRLPDPRLYDPTCLCTDDLYRLMSKCWAADPRERPSFARVLDLLVSYYSDV